MTEQQLQAIRDREKAATPGPWRTRCYAGEGDYEILHPSGEVCTDLTSGEAEFIAHARQDVPSLIAYVEFLEGILADAQKDQTELFRGERQRGREEIFTAAVATITGGEYGLTGRHSIRDAMVALPPVPVVPETIQELREETRRMREVLTHVESKLRPSGFAGHDDPPFVLYLTEESVTHLRELLGIRE